MTQIETPECKFIYRTDDVFAVFDGQGVYEPGMGKVAYDRYAASREVFNSGSDAVGVDLARVCFGDLTHLQNEPTIVQSAIVAVDLAEYAAWREHHNADAEVVSGLSLGMIAAMGAAKYFETYAHAIHAAAIRANIIQEILKDNPGRMAGVVGMAMEELDPILKATGARVAVIRDRIRKSFVVTGGENNIEEAGKEAKSNGARKWELLSIFGSFHHPVLEEGKPLFDEVLMKTFNTGDPSVKLLGNNGEYLETEKATRKQAVDQMTEPADWDAVIARANTEGVKRIVEFGPDRDRGLARQMSKRFGAERIVFPSTV